MADILDCSLLDDLVDKYLIDNEEGRKKIIKEHLTFAMTVAGSVIIGLVDHALERIHSESLTAAEMQDVLLDLRLKGKALMEAEAEEEWAEEVITGGANDEVRQAD